MSDKTLHVILKWNEARIFHDIAPDTILAHCEILRNYSSIKEEQYVWWGKVSVSGYLGLENEDVTRINEQISNGIPTYIFLYCPDKRIPTMHVGKLCYVTIENMSADDHTPLYYRDLAEKYVIPFWFKISDVTEIPFSKTLSKLEYPDGRVFDPVSVNFYPITIQMTNNEIFFKYDDLFQNILEGKMVRCFKTGGACTRGEEISFNPNQMFIGCPFKQEYFNMVNYVVKPVCEELNYSTWIASESFKNIDIMCKVCGGIQSSARAIIDITNWNANVLFELGLLYGLGKDVLLIKHNEDDVPVDLKGIEFMLYDMNNFDQSKITIKQYLGAR